MTAVRPTLVAFLADGISSVRGHFHIEQVDEPFWDSMVKEFIEEQGAVYASHNALCGSLSASCRTAPGTVRRTPSRSRTGIPELLATKRLEIEKLQRECEELEREFRRQEEARLQRMQEDRSSVSRRIAERDDRLRADLLSLLLERARGDGWEEVD